MKYLWAFILCALACLPLPARAQEKRAPNTGTAALEKELYAVELKWMKAEFDKRKTGPDSMGELWADDFFDILPGGQVVNKVEMMDMMAKTDRQPGTGAFPGEFKLRAVYGNVALAISFGFTSGASLCLGSVFMGIGFRLATFGQIYRLFRTIFDHSSIR